MYKSKEEFLKVAKNREEVAEKSKKIMEENLKGNEYFANLLENRKKIKELNEKSYKMQVELNNLKNEIEKTEQEEGYQKSLQNWNKTITIDSYSHEFHEYYYYQYNLDCWRLASPLVEISVDLKERRDLKVWKFEVTSRIKNQKNNYESDINTDVVKFKTKEDALKLAEELKIKLFNQYAEDFEEINNNITLASEVKKAFEGIERNFLPNELQWILAKVYK